MHICPTYLSSDPTTEAALDGEHSCARHFNSVVALGGDGGPPYLRIVFREQEYD